MELLTFKPFTSTDELRAALLDRGCEDAIILLDPDYADAVIGIDDEGRVIYSYDLMVQSLCLTDGMTEEEAAEYIDYNILRSLPYMGEKHPLVMYSLDSPAFCTVDNN